MRMTRKVEVQAISWPSSWLPERQITPAFTCSAKARFARASGEAARSAAAAGCCGCASILLARLAQRG